MVLATEKLRQEDNLSLGIWEWSGQLSRMCYVGNTDMFMPFYNVRIY